MTGDGESGVASRTASTASAPWSVASTCDDDQPKIAPDSRRSAHQDTIVCGRCTSTLSVTERCDTGVQTEAVREHVLDFLRRNGVQVAVVGSLSDDDDCFALPFFAMLLVKRVRTMRFAVDGRPPLTRSKTLHIEVFQSSAVGGRSGINM